MEAVVEAVVEAEAVGVVEGAEVALRAVHSARWCRRNQPRKHFPPSTRTKIKPISTSWIRFLRSTQQAVSIRQAQNWLHRTG